MVKILGLSGSPRKGATETVIRTALEHLEQRGDVETAYMSLAGKKIAPCNGCGYCREHKSWCVLKDDFQEMLDEFITADAYIIGTPVYVHSVTPQIAAFFSRMRPLHHVFPNKLRHKLGAVVAVGGTRNGGEESAATTLIQMMMTRGISVVSNEIGGYIGGKVWSCDKKDFTPADDEIGMNTVLPLAGKLADFTVALNRGLAGAHDE